MANYLDYIKWRGDILFTERGFNEVDNLVFSMLSYINMDDIVPGIESEEDISIEDIAIRYDVLGYTHKEDPSAPYWVLEQAAISDRFRDVRAGSYVRKTDNEREMQFSAVTYFINDHKYMYVAFRGTDSSLVGWKEDFNISFLEKIPAQDEAVAYLNSIARKTSGNIILGGHSKGGNLATYAAAFCDDDVKKRIMCVYSNDGPGFCSSVANSDKFLEILPRVQNYLPESSIIGMLMYNRGEEILIKSKGNEIEQHDPYNWAVMKTSFESADIKSHKSVMLEKTVRTWLDNLSLEDREKFFNVIFDALENSGATTLTEIQDNKLMYYNVINKAVKELPEEDRNRFGESLKKLADAGKDTLWRELIKIFNN